MNTRPRTDGIAGIARKLPITERRLWRMLKEGSDSPLMEIIRRFPGTNRHFAFDDELERFVEGIPAVGAVNRAGLRARREASRERGIRKGDR